MRTIKDHIINPANDKLTISVIDEPGSGGANHCYHICGFDTTTNDSGESSYTGLEILFQNGPIQEKGVNGITQEALLAVVIDRLRSFQAGPYKCYENEKALGRVKEALNWLQQRTLSRMQRGVEGTNNV